MKKIIFIHLLNDRSGSPKVLSQTIKACKDNGYETELWTNEYKDGFLTNIADVNKILFYKRSKNKVLTLFFYLLSQFILFFQCLRYYNKDVVFYINTMMPFGGALSGKFMGKKVFYHIHETSIKPLLLKKLLRFIISITAYKIIYVSEYLKKVESFNGKKETVIYNVLEKNVKKEVHIKKNNFIALMVCSLKDYKGVLEFNQIAKKMQNIESIRFNLVLNATDKEIEEYFKVIDLSDNITVFSRQKDLSAFYKESSILLNLSRPDICIETFGLTILEGMEYGLPVIVPPVGGPSEIVNDGIEGYQISCYETDRIVEKLIFLINNQNEYNLMCLNAKNRVKDFDIFLFEKNILKTIEDQ